MIHLRLKTPALDGEEDGASRATEWNADGIEALHKITKSVGLEAYK